MSSKHHCRTSPDFGAHPSVPGPVRTDANVHNAPTGVVLVGRAGGLRDEAARHFGTVAPIIAQVDHTSQLTDIVAGRKGVRPLAGAGIVFIAEPFLPGLGTRLRNRHRSRGLMAQYAALARVLRRLGADRLVVCSSVFLYSDDAGQPLLPTSPIEPRAETVAAHAAENAARVFTSLGGQSVILRLGWVFDDYDPITAKLVSAAEKGWKLIEGRPSSWVAAIASGDAVRAIHAGFAAPPGTYNVSDGQPVTQGAINAVLERATGKVLHPLYDASWGESGTLFGASRLVADDHFAALTGWQPTGTDLCHYLLLRVRHRSRSAAQADRDSDDQPALRDHALRQRGVGGSRSPCDPFFSGTTI